MNAVPLHERIRTDIRERILSGALAPGARLPSEAELMAQYGCARMTVNKALSTLRDGGLLVRRRRAGTFVADRGTESMVMDIPDFAADLALSDRVYGYRLIARKIREGPDGSMLHLEGLHLSDGRPFAHEDRHINVAAVPEAGDVDFTETPPGTWLLRHIPWSEAEHRIGATGAIGDVAAYLGVAEGAACLTLERQTWRGGESITKVRQTFLAGTYELVGRFGADTADRPNA